MPKIIADISEEIDWHRQTSRMFQFLNNFQVDKQRHLSFTKGRRTVANVLTPSTSPLRVAGVEHRVRELAAENNLPDVFPVDEVEGVPDNNRGCQVHYRQVSSSPDGLEQEHTLNHKKSHTYINDPLPYEFMDDPSYEGESEETKGIATPFSFEYAVDGVPVTQRLRDTLRLVKKSHPRIKCAAVQTLPSNGGMTSYLIIDAYTQAAIRNDISFEKWVSSSALARMEARSRGWYNAYYVRTVQLYEEGSRFYKGQLHDGCYEGGNHDLVYICPHTLRQRHSWSLIDGRLSSFLASYASQSKFPDRMATTIKKIHKVGTIDTTQLLNLQIKTSQAWQRMRQTLTSDSGQVDECYNDTHRQIRYNTDSKDLLGYLTDTVLRGIESTPPPTLVVLLEKFEVELRKAGEEERDGQDLVPMVVLQPSEGDDLYYLLSPEHPSWDDTTTPPAADAHKAIYRVSPEGGAFPTLPDEVGNKISALTMAVNSTAPPNQVHITQPQGYKALPYIGIHDWDASEWVDDDQKVDGPSFSVAFGTVAEDKKFKVPPLLKGVWALYVSVETAKVCHAVGEVVWKK